jgi:hypothetical protein
MVTEKVQKGAMVTTPWREKYLMHGKGAFRFVALCVYGATKQGIVYS